MANKYQHLQEYSGSLYGAPSFENINGEVLMEVHNHYPQGIYSEEASSWDIYGGESPSYAYGEFGNVYDKGLGASYMQLDYPPPTDQTFTQNQVEIKREHFRNVKNTASQETSKIEFIPEPDTPAVVTPKTNSLLIMLMLLFMAGAINSWVNAGELYLSRNGTLDWKSYGLYASILTLILVLMVVYVRV